MGRIRISTTVDATRWAEVNQLMAGPSSRIVDRAIAALLEQLEAEKETAALKAAPYEGDLDLNWEEADLPDLPYEGEVPEQVLNMAAERRRERSA